MSKLYDIYKELKSHDNKKLYLFKSGIFYIFLAEDANIVSNSLGLKLTKFNDTIYKCGFPVSAGDKYFQLLNSLDYSFKIIDSSDSVSYSISEYSINGNISILLEKINKVNTNNLSIKEAYEFIDEIKAIVSSCKV